MLQKMKLCTGLQIFFFLTSCKRSKDYRLTYRQESQVLMLRNARSRNIHRYLKDKMVFLYGLVGHKSGFWFKQSPYSNDTLEI